MSIRTVVDSMENKTLHRLALLCASVCALSANARAQAVPNPYPQKPIRFLVGFPPGGGADIVARLLAKHLTDAWSVTFIVENRPRADSTIASELGAKAVPDGYTLVMVTNAHTTRRFNASCRMTR